MSANNGSAKPPYGTSSEDEHGRKVTRLPLDCGLVAHVTPLPYFALRGIRQRAEELYPNPPEEPYRLPFPESAIENDYKPARENPEYTKLLDEVEMRRSAYIIRCVVLLSTTIADKTPGQLIKESAPRREQMAGFMPLPDDAWEATLLHVLIGDESEAMAIYRIAIGREPLTQEEVHDGVRFFRRRVSGPTRTGIDRETSGVSGGAAESP